MNKLKQFFTDDYDREALLMPAMAVVLTPTAIAALLGFNVNALFGFAIMGVEVAALLFWLVATTIRDAGRALEKRLFSGVLPTNQYLRLREHDGYEVKARRQLLEHASGVTLLNKQQELRNPSDADERIKYAVDVAKEKMRDPQKFKLLRRELKSYGFWRHMAATKWWGFGAAVCSLGAAIIEIFVSSSKLLPVIAALVAMVGSLYWLLAVKDSRVIAAAERYKEQFFKSLTLLP